MTKCELCLEHSGIKGDIETLKKDSENQWTVINSGRKLQYMILGVAAVSPFIVAVLMLFIANKTACTNLLEMIK